MTTKLRSLPKEAQAVWKRSSSKDTWGVEYVYEHGARAIWDAAIRHERRRAAASDSTGKKPKAAGSGE